MSYCLNPRCQRPQNPDNATFCQTCGSRLVLGERYRSLKPIAQGGFGRTFLAVDAHTDQLCVIKQRLPHQQTIAPEQAVQLFRQEAERLAELGQHPQIPRLLAHYELDDGQYDGQYLIQEFVSGENLEELLAQETTFDETQIRELLEELLPVLDFVHQHQVIHRDIKPENIIRPHSGAPYALVDFGASKAVTGLLPQTGTVIGSAGYVAPEQAMGKADYASDLYSLGVTCIHLLTGLHPFDLYSVSDDAWIWRQYLPRPLSSRLRQVLDKLLQKPTRQRYRTAQDVLADLHPKRPASAQSPDRTSARPVNRQSPASRTARSRVSASWRCVRTLTGHDSGVTAIAISPRGHLLASSSDKTIKLWRLATGELLHTFPGRSLWSGSGHADRVNALVFSPNSKVLISGSDDGSIKHWNLATQDLITTLPGQGWGTSALAISPDGYTLASGDRDGKICLWDAETDEPLAQLGNHHEQISSLLFTAQRHTLISSSYDQSICVWDWEEEHLVRTLRGHLDRVSAIALTPDQSILISGSWDKTIKLWHLDDGEQIQVLAAHQDRVNSLAVAPDGTVFASASEDGAITLWHIKTGDRLCTLRHAWGVTAIAFSPDGDTLVSGSADETIKIWQPQ